VPIAPEENVHDPHVIAGLASSILDKLDELVTAAHEWRLDGRERAFLQLGVSTIAKVTAATQSTLLLAPNTDRRGATIYNDAAAILYVKLGDKATTDDWSVALNQGDYYEVPAHYSGTVTGAWATAAAGQARVTELI
jgi:hypothetical protein